jgi:uncharacterized protein
MRSTDSNETPRTLIQKRIVEIFPNRIKGIYLFGSRASGIAKSESDWDIAILPDKPIAAQKIFEASQAIGIDLVADVDLIDLQAASIVLRFEIIGTGERIYTGDEPFCGKFEMTTLSMYQRFNDERKEILEAIKQRGKIYG